MEAVAVERPIIYDINSGKKEISANMELKTLIDKFLKYKKDFVKESTYSNFVLVAENHIKPFFKNIRLCCVNEGLIQDFIIHLSKNGRKDGNGGFAVKTIKDIMLPLHMALDYANKYGAIEKLEWDCIEYPKNHTHDTVHAMTYEQQKAFVQAVYLNLNRHTVSYLISLFTGLRIGEICGLQMRDISIEQQTITVSKTVQRIYDARKKTSKLSVGEPKTQNSHRVIPYPEMLNPILKKFVTDKPEHFFVSGSKTPLEPRTLRQDFTRFLAKNKLEKMKFHDLRHTFATRAIEIPDFDIKSLSAILGHKNVSFTLNVYGRANIAKETECMKLMNALL